MAEQAPPAPLPAPQALDEFIFPWDSALPTPSDR